MLGGEETPAWLTERPFAHRGLHGGGTPENSLPAFERAAEHGYGIEVDVRVTRDGVPVAFHDETLTRLTGAKRSVGEVAFHELEELRLDASDVGIPRLGAVLDRVDGRAPLLVEVKNWQAPGRLERSVRRALETYEGPFAVQSFNPRTLAWFRDREPEWLLGQVAGSLSAVRVESWKRFLLKRLLVTPYSRPDFVAYEHSALPYAPVRMHRGLGLPVLAWTIRSEEEYQRVQPHVDNVIFEGFEP